MRAKEYALGVRWAILTGRCMTRNFLFITNSKRAWLSFLPASQPRRRRDRALAQQRQIATAKVLAEKNRSFNFYCTEIHIRADMPFFNCGYCVVSKRAFTSKSCSCRALEILKTTSP